MYCTYIVASRSHNFYVGVTSDLMKRVWQHKEGCLRRLLKDVQVQPARVV